MSSMHLTHASRVQLYELQIHHNHMYKHCGCVCNFSQWHISSEGKAFGQSKDCTYCVCRLRRSRMCQFQASIQVRAEAKVKDWSA